MTVRHNPYSSGGRAYINKFKKRTNDVNSPPPPFTKFGSPRCDSNPRRLLLRADRIVNNSGSKSGVGESNIGKWISRGNGSSPTLSSSTSKRPFSAVNGVDKPKDPYSLCDSDFEVLDAKKKSDNDPYSVFSDSDSDTFENGNNNNNKTSDNKENAQFNLMKNSTKKVYCNKKKVVPRSRLVANSPETHSDDAFDVLKRNNNNNNNSNGKKLCLAISDNSDQDTSEREINGTSENKENKENSLFFSPPRVYRPREREPNSSGKKLKPVSLSKSRLLCDISPEKVEKAYGTVSVSVSVAEKENVPTELNDVVTDITSPHLIG